MAPVFLDLVSLQTTSSSPMQKDVIFAHRIRRYPRKMHCLCNPDTFSHRRRWLTFSVLTLIASSTFGFANVAIPQRGFSSCVARSSDNRLQHKTVAKDKESYTFWGENLTLAQFNMDLQNLAAMDPDQAQDAIEIMTNMYRQNPHHAYTVEPNTICYHTVMEGYATAGRPEEVDQVLTFLEEHESLEPDERSYMIVAQAWAETSSRGDIRGNRARRAQDILDRMRSRNIQPSVKIYTIVLEAWCKRAGKVREATSRALGLLKEMEESDQDNCRPNVLTYTSYIGGLARCRDRDLATRAQETLERMRKLGVQPDVVAYTSVLNCWSKATSKRERHLAASKALAILDEMEDLYIIHENYQCKPSPITYATAIRAIGHSFNKDAPKLALNVLERMYRLHETGTIANVKPTTATYNAVLHALSRAQCNRVFYAQRAEELLNEMEALREMDSRPNVRSWAAVMRAWAHCGQADAAEQAERVLLEMDRQFHDDDSIYRPRPNFVCYTQCMGAWAHSRRADALDRMEDLLKRMEQGYQKTREADIRPNTISYVTAIDAFIRRDEENAATRAQATVDRMTRLYALGLGHVRPTKIIFNTLIHAWSKSNEKDAATKAEKIFQWMESQYKSGDDLVQPDEVSLCAVLNAWASHAQNGGAQRALQIYEHTESMSAEERGFHLSITMPNIVVKAIARSQERDNVKQAEALLEKLERDYASGKSSLRPDVTTYSSVINCCAYHRYAESKAQALETALRTFRKICESEEETPNNITFGTLFKVISNQMPNSEERRKLSQNLFKQCRSEGFVDSFVLAQLRNASPVLYTELKEKYLGQRRSNFRNEMDTMVQNMPPEWSENVVV